MLFPPIASKNTSHHNRQPLLPIPRDFAQADRLVESAEVSSADEQYKNEESTQ